MLNDNQNYRSIYNIRIISRPNGNRNWCLFAGNLVQKLENIIHKEGVTSGETAASSPTGI